MTSNSVDIRHSKQPLRQIIDHTHQRCQQLHHTQLEEKNKLSTDFILMKGHYHLKGLKASAYVSTSIIYGIYTLYIMESFWNLKPKITLSI